MLMKTVNIGWKYYLRPVRGSENWYWGMDYTSGDLYEAAQLFKGGHSFRSNRVVFVRWPEGTVMEPVKAGEGQYLGDNFLCRNELVYGLLADFPQSEIRIFSISPDETVQTVAVLPLALAGDCQNLHLNAEQLMLTCYSAVNTFHILWTETDGVVDVAFPIGEHEGFSHVEGNALYFTRWWEQEEPVYEYHAETIVRSFQGEILDCMDGGLFEIRPGEYWVLR